MSRKYYSARVGRHAQQLSLEELKHQFLAVYQDLEDRDYLQQWFGYFCNDGGEMYGAAGNPNRYILRRLRKPDIWPIPTFLSEYTEDDLFDVIEFFYDHVSQPFGGRHHSYLDCGWHYDQ